MTEIRPFKKKITRSKPSSEQQTFKVTFSPYKTETRNIMGLLSELKMISFLTIYFSKHDVGIKLIFIITKPRHGRIKFNSGSNRTGPDRFTVLTQTIYHCYNVDGLNYTIFVFKGIGAKHILKVC